MYKYTTIKIISESKKIQLMFAEISNLILNSDGNVDILLISILTSLFEKLPFHFTATNFVVIYIFDAKTLILIVFLI